MQIVIDSNVLFSALIKDSFTRKTILEHDGFFLFPAYVFEELEKHKTELMEKSGMVPAEFNLLSQIILQKVLVVPNEVLNSHFNEAMSIIEEIDPDDAPFIACALAYPESVFWSDDKKLKKQSKVKVLNSQEISLII
jgi:predicted nucleic acid-binding protein